MSSETLLIIDTADDGSEFDGGYDSGFVFLGSDGTPYVAAYSFPGSTVPNAATVSLSTLTVSNITELGSGTHSYTIRAQKTTSAAQPSGSNLPSGWTGTTASASLLLDQPLGSSYNIDVTAIVQEIVNQGGWNPGTNGRINFIIVQSTVEDEEAQLADFSATTPTASASLVTTYSGGGGGGGGAVPPRPPLQYRPKRKASRGGLVLFRTAVMAPPAPQNVTPGVGALAFAGLAPTVVASNNQNVQAGLGAVVIAGKAPTVTASNNQNVSPGVGSVTLASFTPTVVATANQNVTPPTGSVVIASSAPSIVASNNQTVAPGVGQVVFAGLPPTISATGNKNVTPGVGAVLIASSAPSISTSANQNVTPGVGNVGLTGYNPSVFASDFKNTIPGVGQIAFVGLAPNISVGANQFVTPGVGPVSIAGYPPVITTSDAKVVAPGVGPVLIAGYPPSISVSDNKNVTPGTASLVIAGYAPTIQTPRNVSPGVGAMLITGYAPAIVIASAIGFPDLPVWIEGLSVLGFSIPGPILYNMGDHRPITFRLLQRSGRPVDLTHVTALRWTVQQRDNAPIIDHRQLAIVDPPTFGRVTYTPDGSDTIAGGRYLAQLLATYDDTTTTAVYPTGVEHELWIFDAL